MVKMAIYTQKCEQKWLKINNRAEGGGAKGVVIKTSWVEKNRKINNRGWDNYSELESTDWALFANSVLKLQIYCFFVLHVKYQFY